MEIYLVRITLPKTNIATWQMDGWETTFILGQSAYVQVRLLLVSGRLPHVCINFDPSKNGSQFTPPKTNIIPENQRVGRRISYWNTPLKFNMEPGNDGFQ